MEKSPMSHFAAKKKKPPKRKQKGSQSSKPSNPSKSSGFNINVSMLSHNLSMLTPHISVDEFTLYKRTGLDKVQVERLVKGYSETSAQKINDLNGRLALLEENQRRLFNQELGPRLVKLEEQLQSGVSEKQIIEAHAQGANENMKGVLTGVACTILIGLLIVGGWSYVSKRSFKEAAGETDDRNDSDDDWQNAAKASSVEKLEFAMAKLQKMKV
jgi:hypothetical protein